MRTITILTVTVTVAVIMTTVLAYNSMREDTGSKSPQANTSQIEAASRRDIEDKLDELATILQRYQQTTQDQLQQAQVQQAHLSRTLADLEARLQSIEPPAFDQPTDAVVSNSVGQSTDLDVSYNSGAQDPELEKISQAELSQQMDENLRVGNLDRKRTKLARERVEESLANIPDVILKDIQCGNGFCRANFTHANGQQPDIRGLFGVPPFENAGFTIQEADGSVSLYSTEPGMSLGDFQSDARETTSSQ